MREPVNNQWLSPELKRLTQDAPGSKAPYGPGHEDGRSYSRRRNTGPTHRAGPAKGRRGQWWQYLATLLLLLGSAAFSYVAWSEADTAGRQPPPGLPAVAPLAYVQRLADRPATTASAEAAGNTRTATTPASNSAAIKDANKGASASTPSTVTEAENRPSRSQVNALREQNRQLLRRLAELQATLDAPTAD